MQQVSILHYAGPPIIGGVENTIYFQAKYLTSHGFKVKIIAGRGSECLPGSRFIQLPLLDSKAPQITQLNKKLFAGQMDQEFHQLKEEIKAQLRPVLTDTQYLIAHNVFTLHKNLPLTCALIELAEQFHKKEKAMKIIAWCHDLAYQDPLYAPDLHPGYPWEVLANVHPHIQYVTISAHRQELLSKLLGLPKEDIPIIPPGVDLDLFFQLHPLLRELSERLELFAAWPLFIYPARITRRKNIELAIAIMASIVRKLPSSKLLVTGPPGPHNPANLAYLQQLNTMRQQAKLDDRVIFLYEQGTGNEPLILGPEMVANLYRLADGMLFPSKREGFGMPVLEAATFRLPIFTSSLPSIQAVAKGYAQFFDPSSPPELIARDIITFYRQDPTSQFKHRVLKEYTWQAILSKKLLPLLR